MGITGTALATAVAGAVVSKALAPKAPKPTAVAAPVLEAPVVMPLPDDQAAQAAKRRSIAAQVVRRGRASTILSDSSSETLG